MAYFYTVLFYYKENQKIQMVTLT